MKDGSVSNNQYFMKDKAVFCCSQEYGFPFTGGGHSCSWYGYGRGGWVGEILLDNNKQNPELVGFLWKEIVWGGGLQPPEKDKIIFYLAKHLSIFPAFRVELLKNSLPRMVIVGTSYRYFASFFRGPQEARSKVKGLGQDHLAKMS